MRLRRNDSSLVVLDQRIGRVVVNRFEVFRFDHVSGNPGIGIQTGRHIAHHILDKLGIVIGALGDILLIRALEQAKQFA